MTRDVARAAPLTAREAVAQAAAEGITLEPSSNESGYKGVSIVRTCKTKPYHVRVTHTGKTVRLSSFATCEEAALTVARNSAAACKAYFQQSSAFSAIKRAAPPCHSPPSSLVWPTRRIKPPNSGPKAGMLEPQTQAPASAPLARGHGTPAAARHCKPRRRLSMLQPRALLRCRHQ